MGIGEEVKEKVEEEERRIIYDIVKELPLVPDQVRNATWRAYTRVVSKQPAGFRCEARRLRAHVCMLGCCARGEQRLRVLARAKEWARASQAVPGLERPREHPVARWARNSRVSDTGRTPAL